MKEICILMSTCRMDDKSLAGINIYFVQTFHRPWFYDDFRMLHFGGRTIPPLFLFEDESCCRTIAHVGSRFRIARWFSEKCNSQSHTVHICRAQLFQMFFFNKSRDNFCICQWCQILCLVLSICIGLDSFVYLSRAPVLVALALIELGMKYEDAVELIRE